MMKRLRHTIRLTSCASVAGACLWLMHAADAAEPKTDPAAAPTRPRVEIRDFMFKPAALTIKAGTAVTFVNRDEEPHTVASADGKFTRSKPLDTDQEFTLTLNTPGEYAYFCTVHPHMTGKITVAAP